jgi:hypothetical protein
MKARISRAFTDESWRCARVLDTFAIVALLTTFSLRYAPFLTSHLLFGPFLDNVHMYGPIFSEVSRLALSGAVPYYLPDIGTGFPIFESPHFSILYPFYFFGVLNYGGPLSSLYTLTNLTLLHILVFYVNLYVLLRCATISPWASYVGASVGMLARNTELYASWITITASYAWLPLVFAGGVLLLRFPAKPCGILVFSIAAGLLALASPSQPVIHAALGCLILFTAGVLWLCFERRFQAVLQVAWSLAVCGVIAFGLAGAAILPMYLATGEMIRAIGQGAAVIGHAGIPWAHFNLHQLTLDQAIGILVRPTWITNVVGSPYVGPLGVLGTLATAIYFRRLDRFGRVLAVAFGVISLYGLLSGFGTNLGLAYVNFHLPLVNRIREAGRHLILFVIGASFLSGLGYSLLARNVTQYNKSRKLRQLIVPALLLAAFAMVVFWEFVPKKFIDPELFLRGSGGPWVIASAPFLFVLGRVFKFQNYAKMVSAAALVSAAAVVIPIRGISLSLSEFNKPTNLLSHKVVRDFGNSIDTKDYRMDFRDTNFPVRFWAMNASYYGIKSFYNQLTPQPLDQLRFSNLTNVPQLREMMGACYVLCGPDNAPINQNAQELFEIEGYRLYENPNPMGRLTLVHQVAGFCKSEKEFLNKIRGGFDYLSAAYVDSGHFRAVRQLLGDSQGWRPSQDRIVKIADQANRSYSKIESDAASLLVLNEWFTPTWKVRVNGKKQSVLRVNQWQTGVLLPAGTNLVEFEYRPTLFRILMILNRIMAGLLVIFVLFVVAQKRRLKMRDATKPRDDLSH